MRIFTLIVFALLSGCTPPAPLVIEGNTMGTTYSVKIVSRVNQQIDERALRADIEARLVQVNDLMSTYIIDSEISRFNQSPSGKRFELSEKTMKVLQLAQRIYEMSGGKFDVTIGPLVNLWGFGPEPGDGKVPALIDIQRTLSRVGMDKLELDAKGLTKHADLYIDLSAIAKGFGVDELADLLSNRGIDNYLVDIGGELRAQGKNARGQPWRIAIELPEVSRRIPYKAIEITDMAMATSGDYRNYFEVDGKRYSHTINPQTGFPIDHNVASVTVLARSTAMADGLATAINVMGADAGLAMAEQYKLAVLVIIRAEDKFVERFTSAFEPYKSEPLIHD